MVVLYGQFMMHGQRNIKLYYKFVLDVHTLLFSILISTTGMIQLNNWTALIFVTILRLRICDL